MIIALLIVDTLCTAALLAMLLATVRERNRLRIDLADALAGRDRTIAERNNAWDAFARANNALSAVSPCPECVAREAALAGAP